MSETQSSIVLDAAQQKRGRMIFLLLAIFFTVPIVVVVTMIKLDWRPGGKSHGSLLQPPVSLAQTRDWVSDRGEHLPQFWQDKWNILYVTDHCEAECMQHLHDMRQIYVSLYKDMVRVQRVLVTRDKDTTAIRASYPDLLIINGNEASINTLAQLLTNDGVATLQAKRLYFIDPLGNAMMQYAPETAAKYIRQDLNKLLRSSWAA